MDEQLACLPVPRRKARPHHPCPLQSHRCGALLVRSRESLCVERPHASRRKGRYPFAAPASGADRLSVVADHSHQPRQESRGRGKCHERASVLLRHARSHISKGIANPFIGCFHSRTGGSRPHVHTRPRKSTAEWDDRGDPRVTDSIKNQSCHKSMPPHPHPRRVALVRDTAPAQLSCSGVRSG